MTSKTLKPALSALILGMMALFSGCAYTVDTLIRDNDLRHKVLASCVKQGLEASKNQSCINAAEAQARVTGKKVKGLFD